MREIIEQILNEIPRGKLFDSHLVVNLLIKNHSDDYLNFANSMKSSDSITLAVHGQIGKLVNTFDNDIIQRQEHESWSENIHGKPSKCTCWVKL